MVATEAAHAGLGMMFGSGCANSFEQPSDVPICGSTKPAPFLSTASPVESSAMLAPACGLMLPNAGVTARALVSEGPTSVALLKKRESHCSNAAASDVASFLPTFIVSQVGRTPGIPLHA